MEEKIVIEGKLKSNLLFKVLLIVGCIFLALGIIYCVITEAQLAALFGYRVYFFSTILQGMIFGYGILGIFIDLGLILIILAFFFKLMMSKCAITVTDRRVIGKANFGKRVDLPLNQISAVSQGMFSSIAVATSSGKICFWCLENRDKVLDSLSALLGNHQISKVQVDMSNINTEAVQQVSGADELKKYKDLLDQGIISKEEFDAKKKQLLGL